MASEMKTFTISSPDGKAKAVISTYGACLHSLLLPATAKEARKEPVDVVLGYKDLASYEVNEPSLGVVVGRVAGRISNASFHVNFKEYILTRNLNNQHCLHGGKKGLYHVNWDPVFINNQKLTLNYTSPEGEDGFPGSMHVELTYKIDQIGNIYSLSLHYKATLRASACPLNITNHSYFNLAGHDAGKSALEKHRIQICGKKSLALDPKTLLPTGEVVENQGAKDLSTEKSLKEGLEKGGFDQFYIFDSKLDHEVRSKIGACEFSAYDPESGRKMLGKTNQVGVQFYTADCLKTTQPAGKHGKPYEALGAFCFETQAHPNAINLPEDMEDRPNIIYWPKGEPYIHHTVFYFYDTNAITKSN